ncbi:DUF2691 family protein [Exiguobacterium sp. ZOR0005]|uniref:DUF2691 family protein n=1 Tax=Exiguobacterium sp. ZOR0005 TaxID=1339226 RepID=UPI0003FDEBB0|nr:DUF2691 family protein [Exiguobacterium sp. ZOR0005]
MRRGVSFKIPNAYGSYLSEILRPIEVERYTWLVGGEESYVVGNDGIDPLFQEPTVMEGGPFTDLITHGEQYLIFVDLKAFLNGPITEIETYEAFLSSPCDLAVLIVDSMFVDIYCKNPRMIDHLYEHMLACGFADVTYLTDANDSRTRLTIW